MKYVYHVDDTYDNTLTHFDLIKAVTSLFSGGSNNSSKKGGITAVNKNKSSSTKQGKLSKALKSSKAGKLGKFTNSNKSGKSGKYGREWKNHKWVARKRNAEGKWIYDYGDGYPDEKNQKGFGGSQKVDVKGDTKLELTPPSALQKIATPIVGLGKALFSPDLNETIKGGSEFLGGISSTLKNIKAGALKLGTETDPTSGLQVKHADLGKQFDLESVNPDFDNKDGGSQNNCSLCAVAYDMRRRGFECTAKESQTWLSGSNVISFYKDPVVKNVYSDNTNDYKIDVKTGAVSNTGLSKAVEKELKTEPDGSRGIAMLSWAGGGGHTVAYEREGNNTFIYDAQSGEKLEISKYVDKCESFVYYRTDNLEPNYDQVRKVVE